MSVVYAAAPSVVGQTSDWLKPIARDKRVGEFHYGCCGCMEDCQLCLCGWCLYPCLLSQNSADLDGNPNYLWCCYPAGLGQPWSCTSKVRAQAQAQFGIRSDCCVDSMMELCVPCLSQIQVAREIKWHKENRPAPAVQAMSMAPNVYAAGAQ